MIIQNCRMVILGWEDLKPKTRKYLEEQKALKSQVLLAAKSLSNYSENARKHIQNCDFSVFRYFEEFTTVKNKYS